MIGRHVRLLLQSAVSGGVLAISWPGIADQTYLIFVAFIPLLLSEYELNARETGKKGLWVFINAYLCFIVFNFWTTWWIKLASPGGMVLAVVFNSLFMSLVFLAFHITKRFVGRRAGYLALVAYWLGFEYLHINWELSWIWLLLGNVFANDIEWIQWYEYSGVLGGTTWILALNVLIFKAHVHLRYGNSGMHSQFSTYLLIALLIFVPLSTSNDIFENYHEKRDIVEVVVLQPNIDPYRDKFNGMTERDQIDRLVELAQKSVRPGTEVIFGPETAFPLSYWEDELNDIYGTGKVRQLLSENSRYKFIVGLSTIRLYVNDEESTPTAREMKDGSSRYYDYFNAVMQIDSSDQLQVYRKSKLVLGVEKMPFSSNLKFLESLSIELGGTSGSLGTEEEPVLFESASKSGRKLKIAPVICYESIYGEYLTEFVNKGANLVAIVTNDGWWGNTPGYGQHLAYGRLRAIELRRSIARSANTGISALINQKGEIIAKTDWWTEASLRGELNLNQDMTFYSRHGDFIGRIAAFMSVLLLLWTVVSAFRNTRNE